MAFDDERISIFHGYLLWHYRQGLFEFFDVVSNFLTFVSNFFSFKLFYRTLLMPLAILGHNPLSSFVGLISRIAVMFLGVVSYLFVVLSAFLFFVVWIFAPAVVIGGLVLAATFFAI